MRLFAMLATTLTLLATSASAQEIKVFAAGSLKAAMGDVFQAGTPLRAVSNTTANKKNRERMTLRMGTMSQRKLTEM